VDSIFKAYDIRGRYPDEINAGIAGTVGRGFIRVIGAKRIVVGRDMRPSSPELATAFIEGAVCEGAAVTDIGKVSTPLLNYTIIEGKHDGGAMVTASHLPADMNGFKLSRAQAIPLSAEQGLPQLEQLVESFQGAMAPCPHRGSCERISMLEPYIGKISSFVEDPTPLTFVVDAGNGMAGPEVTLLFRAIPAWTLVPLYFRPDERFPHHVPNPALPGSTRDLEARVVAEGADLGVAFDGDVDRCGFIDENGNRVRGDLVTALLAGYFLERERQATVLYDLRSSRIVPEIIASKNGTGVRTRVGHAFIRPLMREKNAVFAGELSGHYYYRDSGFSDNGLLTMVTMANLLSREGRSLSSLVRPLDIYASTGEINIRVTGFTAIETKLEATYHDGKKDRLDGLTISYPDWWFNLRCSHTEPVARLVIETSAKDKIKEKKDEVLAAIGEADPGMEIMGT
jgi:phosphomannomutase